MHVQGRIYPHFTYGAKPRSTVAECPVWPITNTPSEALHFLGPSSHRFEDSLRPTSAQGYNIRRRNMTRPRSSHRLDPGNILVNGFLLSKARRPNASGERDKSRSTTQREHISFVLDRSSSWETRILWALARYVQIGELCPKVDIASVTVPCRNKAQQPCSSPYQRPRCKSQSSESNKRQQVQVETYKPVSSQ